MKGAGRLGVQQSLLGRGKDAEAVKCEKCMWDYRIKEKMKALFLLHL